MSPIVICRHYEVEWLDNKTCFCHACGRQGHWTDKGFAIWIRTDRNGVERERARRHAAAQNMPAKRVA